MIQTQAFMQTQARIADLTRCLIPSAPSFDAVWARTQPAAGGQVGPAQMSSSPGWSNILPPEGAQWISSIENIAADAGVDPQLLTAVVWAESGFDPTAESPAGAFGLAQLMPGTADELGVDATVPLENLLGGATYLRRMLDRFGDVPTALAAYNAGPGRVSQAGGIPDIPETIRYVERVLTYYDSLGGTA